MSVPSTRVASFAPWNVSYRTRERVDRARECVIPTSAALSVSETHEVYDVVVILTRSRENTPLVNARHFKRDETRAIQHVLYEDALDVLDSNWVGNCDSRPMTYSDTPTRVIVSDFSGVYSYDDVKLYIANLLAFLDSEYVLKTTAVRLGRMPKLGFVFSHIDVLNSKMPFGVEVVAARLVMAHIMSRFQNNSRKTATGSLLKSNVSAGVPVVHSVYADQVGIMMLVDPSGPPCAANLATQTKHAALYRYCSTIGVADHTVFRILLDMDASFDHTTNAVFMLKRLRSSIVTPSVSFTMMENAVVNAERVARACNTARRLTDLRELEAKPYQIVDTIKRMFDGLPVRINVIVGKELLARNLNLIEAVGRGSGDVEPHFLVVEYEHPEADTDMPWFTMVGKGITFDTGGEHHKSSKSIRNMHFDKAGAIAVVCALHAAVLRGDKIRASAYCAFVENGLGPRANKPLDVVTSCSGLTVCMENTDAEGRLTLADSITWARKRHNDHMVLATVATLTGAVHTALGSVYTGMYSNNEQFADRVIHAGNISGEPMWRMPLNVEYERVLRTKQNADVSNMAPNAGAVGAGSCVAAAFLNMFVYLPLNKQSPQGSLIPWVHMDIASTAVEDASASLPSGKPVKTLCHMMKQHAFLHAIKST